MSESRLRDKTPKTDKLSIKTKSKYNPNNADKDKKQNMYIDTKKIIIKSVIQNKYLTPLQSNRNVKSSNTLLHSITRTKSKEMNKINSSISFHTNVIKSYDNPKPVYKTINNANIIKPSTDNKPKIEFIKNKYSCLFNN